LIGKGTLRDTYDEHVGAKTLIFDLICSDIDYRIWGLPVSSVNSSYLALNASSFAFVVFHPASTREIGLIYNYFLQSGALE
jgi:hypothetical protein